MKLSKKQQNFTIAIANLILHAESLGYGLTFGDCYRSNKVFYGHPESTHRSRLAVDFNIFENGNYLDGIEAEYAHNQLHNFWDLEGGSERIANDLNHYSFKHRGIR